MGLRGVGRSCSLLFVDCSPTGTRED